MGATHTGALRTRCAHLRAVRSSIDRRQFSRDVRDSRPETKASPKTLTLEFVYQIATSAGTLFLIAKAIA
jgi:hypothetical protein